jgi:hypothetical protein
MMPDRGRGPKPSPEAGKVVFDANDDWEDELAKDKRKRGAQAGMEFESSDHSEFADEEQEKIDDELLGEERHNLFGSSGTLDKKNQKKGEDSAEAELKRLTTSDPDVLGGNVEYNQHIDFVIPEKKKNKVEEIFVAAESEHFMYFKSTTKRYEDFYVGFTQDSAPGWTVDPPAGTLNRKGEEDTMITVTSPPGDSVAYLCFIMPEMKFQSKYYKIEAKKDFFG